MQPKKGIEALISEAQARVRALSVAEVDSQRGQDGVLLVDLRDIRELQREGRIPGSLHVPRGMLEFWVDPDSPYYRQEFAAARSLILYCNKGWRSALAACTLQDMGIDSVAHLAGGLEQWQAEGGAVELPTPRR